MFRKVPLIVILGSTGTGKTKLSLELAERFGGEIISADSMQVYANLDIATAKATKAEQSRARHHLLDVATPAEPFTVVHFRNAALPIIENLLAQSKCPIVVGGTNYYIESLLWDILVSPTKSTTTTTATPTNALSLDSRQSATNAATTSANLKNELSVLELSTMSSELLHNHLKKIDPETANRIHPNNRRKILRAIEVFQETGQTLSSKLLEQRQQPGGNRLAGPLRYPHTILFWLRCNQDVLDARLDKRVDAMLEQGLLREIRAFHDAHKCDKSGSTGSESVTTSEDTYTKGVLQTIGFKEFIPYLEQFNAVNDQQIEDYLRQHAYKMPAEDQFKSSNSKGKKTKSSTNEPSDKLVLNELPAGLELLNSCLNELKLVTRRYSKKQIKWINNRFLASTDRQVPELYELDTSDVSLWHEVVFRRAESVVDCYRCGQICEVEPMAKRQHPSAGLNEETSHFCVTCERHFVGEFQWKLHQKSNKHKRRKEGQKKKEKLAQLQMTIETCENQAVEK